MAAITSLARGDGPKIKVTSKDDETFEIDLRVAQIFGTVKDMLAHLNIEDTASSDPIPLPEVPSEILKKIVQWCEYHKDHKEVLEGDDEELAYRTDDISEWDQGFLAVDQKTLFGIMLAADFLHIKGLLDICCKTVANMLKGKSVEQVRAEFNIKNDFTPEEEEAIRRENEWFEDRDNIVP